MQIFDPKQEFCIVERRLPHWSQAGTITFVTWRTWDSIPEKFFANGRANEALGCVATTSIPRLLIGRRACINLMRS